MYTPELTPSPNAANFATNLRWCNSAEGMTMQPINTYVVGTIFLLPVSRNEENAARTFKLSNRTHGTAETPIEGWNFIAGDLTAADRITGHLVIISRRLGANLNECPNLNAYANRLEIRAAFKIAPPA